MRQSGLLVWNVLKKLGEMAVEGVSTLDLEILAEKMIADAGAKPAFKGYFVQAAGERYRFVLCTSINEEIVHGMPSAKRVLKSGDILSIDTGVELNGYYGDSALTVPVGEVSEETRRLMRVTEESLNKSARATGFLTFVGRSSGTWFQTASRSCVSLSDTASGPSCMKSRRFPITWTGRMRTPGSRKAWCWLSNRWSTPAARSRRCAVISGPRLPRTDPARRISSTVWR